MLLRGGPLTAHVYVCAPLAAGADRRTLAAQAQGVIEAALREMQGGAAPSGALVAEQAQTSASSETMIEPADNSVRSPGV